MFTGGSLRSSEDRGGGLELGAAYRLSRGTSFGLNLALQSGVSFTGLFRFAGTGVFTPTFEVGLGYGSAQSDALVVRTGVGLAFNVNIADRLLLSFGPMGAAEAWVGGESDLRWTFGLDLRVTLPLTQPPPPPPVRYARIVSTVRVQGSDDAPEITTTPIYAQMLPTVHHVAVRAPSNCENARATQTTGQTQGVGQEILHTTCGVEMAELERRLTRQGFVVTSWTTLSNTVDTQHITPVQAAQQLGAEVLFQVNSLERTRGNTNRTFVWEQMYQLSNEYGDEGPALPLPDRERAMIRGYVREAELRLIGAARLGATFDVNAIAVETGQSFWFFRWNHLQAFENEGRVTGLAQQVGEGPWVPVFPQTRAVLAPTVESVSARDAQRIDESGAAADAQQALYNDLVRDAIDRFVTSFSPQTVQTVAPPPRRRGEERSRAEEPPPPPPPAVVIPAVAAPPPPPPPRRHHRRSH